MLWFIFPALSPYLFFPSKTLLLLPPMQTEHSVQQSLGFALGSSEDKVQDHQWTPGNPLRNVKVPAAVREGEPWGCLLKEALATSNEHDQMPWTQGAWEPSNYRVSRTLSAAAQDRLSAQLTEAAKSTLPCPERRKEEERRGRRERETKLSNQHKQSQVW